MPFGSRSQGCASAPDNANNDLLSNNELVGSSVGLNDEWINRVEV